MTIRVQAKLKSGVVKVKSLINHPMETGMRKDRATGKVVPAQFIEELTCKHNDKVVMSALWSGGISKNPYCAFEFKGGEKGDTVTLSWKDNTGKEDSAETKIR